LQAAGAKLTGQKPVRFVAPGSLTADLSDGDLVIVRFSRADCSTVAQPVSASLLSCA